MPFTLQSELQTVRTALLLDGIPVVIRATMSPGDELPASGNHIVVDLVPGPAGTDFGGTVFEDLDLQLQVWSDTSLVSALTSAEAARGRMEGLEYYRSSGTRIERDGDYVGVIMTFISDAQFDDIA